MTAEVAILNKSAVALAADSAVSIGRPGNRKVYNTVNKIFELSCSEPIGIMIYGRLDFMGLPLETIIKDYRNNFLKRKSFPYVSDYREDFCSHLRNNIRVTDDDVKSNVFTVLYDAFDHANSDIDELILQDIVDHGTFRKSKVNNILQTYIKQQIAKLKSMGFASGFSRKAVPDNCDVAVDACIKMAFRALTLNETSKRLVKEFAGYLLSKEQLSEMRTGIVITGFGRSDFCPSLDNIEIDGMIDGKLKMTSKPYIDITRHETEADILGFAQDDMVKSFLNGIDPLFEEYAKSCFSNAITQSSNLLLGAFVPDVSQQAQYKAALAKPLKSIADDLNKEFAEYLVKNSSKPIRDMIRSMPKQELASLASSLIEITSLKRKVTRVQETVGGPVDVAIVSKADGFVWVKRKHYFPAELNRRFMVRKFGKGVEV